MYKLTCTNSKEFSEIYLYLSNEKKQISSKRYDYDEFSLNDISDFLKMNSKKFSNNPIKPLDMIIHINDEYDLLKMLEIINNSKDLIFTLDLTSVEITHKRFIKIVDSMGINNIKIKYQKDSKVIMYDEYRKMYTKLYKIIDEVKSLNLSPLEEVMYVFDIVKSNIYKEDEENKSNSRDLNSVVNTDYIVCVGYSNYMEFILKELNHDIKSLSFCYDNSQNGHKRNSIHLIDEKYKIDNLFFIDATDSSKKSENDEEYINNYCTFLKTYEVFRRIKEGEHFRNDYHYFILEHSNEEIIEMIKKGSYLENDEYKNLIVHSLRPLCDMKEKTELEITKALINDDRDELLNYYKKMYDFCNTPLISKKFIECLYNVRKAQYKTGIINSIPTIDEFEKIMIRNYGKEYFISSKEQRLFEIFFGKCEKTNREMLEERIKSFIQEEKTLKKSK